MSTIPGNSIPGTAGDIVVVRVMYLWPVFFGPIAFNHGKSGQRHPADHGVRRIPERAGQSLEVSTYDQPVISRTEIFDRRRRRGSDRVRHRGAVHVGALRRRHRTRERNGDQRQGQRDCTLRRRHGHAKHVTQHGLRCRTF